MKNRKLIALALALFAGAANAEDSHFSLTFQEYRGYKIDQACSKQMFRDFELAAKRDEINYSGNELLAMKRIHIEAINMMAKGCDEAEKKYAAQLK